MLTDEQGLEYNWICYGINFVLFCYTHNLINLLNYFINDKTYLHLKYEMILLLKAYIHNRTPISLPSFFWYRFYRHKTQCCSTSMQRSLLLNQHFHQRKHLKKVVGCQVQHKEFRVRFGNSRVSINFTVILGRHKSQFTFRGLYYLA